MRYAGVILLSIISSMSLVGCGEAEFDSAAAQLRTGPSAAHSEMKVSSPNIADGESVTYVDLIIRDERNLPVQGYKPDMKMSGQGNIIGRCTVTDAAGRSRCTIWSSMSEEKEIVVAGTNLKKDVLWVPAPKFQSAFSVVSSGYQQTAPEAYMVVTAAGLPGSSAIQVADANGSLRMISTHFATFGE